jgi:hypothetical protein
MIDEYFKKLNTTIASVSMTEDERARVRGALVTEMAKAPLGRFDTLIETTAWYFSTINYRRIVAAATASAFLFTMGGVSYAAEAALPGDKLYVVKTDFNEAVVEFLAVSDKDKAKVQTEFAQKRLEEASQLAADGKLDQGRKDIVSKKLKEHVSAVKEELDQIVEREDFVSAVEVATEFEATVRAHTDVLIALVEQPAPEPVETPDSSEEGEEGTDSDGEPSEDSGLAVVDNTETADVSLMAAVAVEDGASARMTGDASVMIATDSVAMTPENVVSLDLVSSVIADVADVVAEITVVREQAQNAVADSMLVSKRTLAEEKRAEIEAVVSDVERALSSTSTLVIEVAASASSTLMSIREGIATGNTAFNENRFDDAFRTYNEALLAARELDEKVSALADLPRQVIVTTPVVVIPEQQEVVAPVEPQTPVVVPTEPVLEVVPPGDVTDIATSTASTTPVVTATTTATSTASSTISVTATTILGR